LQTKLRMELLSILRIVRIIGRPFERERIRNTTLAKNSLAPVPPDR